MRDTRPEPDEVPVGAAPWPLELDGIVVGA